MRGWLLEWLRCPECAGTLQSREIAHESDEILEACLLCRQCRAWYPVVAGVPRLLPQSLRYELTRSFAKRHAAILAELGLAGSEPPLSPASDGPLGELKRSTQRNFGFEWTEYARHGWDDAKYDLQFEQAVFASKSLLVPEDVGGRLVLDAGCGNGRYSHWAGRYGGRVIGVDLTQAVDAAFANTRELENIAIVQADLFQLPFAPCVFDVIFSIGVLMHTGDAGRAFASLKRHLREGGTMTVHLYGAGNRIYEKVDALIRRRTTKMSVAQLQRFTARAHAVARILDVAGMRQFVSSFVRLDEHPHCIFDWYAAPIATHHSYPEVLRWFEEEGISVVATNERVRSSQPLKRIVMHAVRFPWPVTVRGILRAPLETATSLHSSDA